MDGQGGTEKLDWENVPKWQDEHEPIWLHFDCQVLPRRFE
jgi:hypothetical protein